MRPFLVPSATFVVLGILAPFLTHATFGDSLLLLIILWLVSWLAPIIASRLASGLKRALLACLFAILAVTATDALGWLTIGNQARFGLLRHFPLHYISAVVGISLVSLFITSLSRVLTLRSTRTQQPQSSNLPHA